MAHQTNVPEIFNNYFKKVTDGRTYTVPRIYNKFNYLNIQRAVLSINNGKHIGYLN